MAKASSNTLSAEELDQLIEAMGREDSFGRGVRWQGTRSVPGEAGVKLLALDRDGQAEAVARLVDRIGEINGRIRAMAEAADGGIHPGRMRSSGWQKLFDERVPFQTGLAALLLRKLPLSERTVSAMLGWIVEEYEPSSCLLPFDRIAGAVENLAAGSPLGDDLMAAARALIGRLKPVTWHSDDATAAIVRLSKLLPEGPSARIDPGEAWSDVALADLAAMAPDRHAAWNALLTSCQEAGKGKPSARWLKEIGSLRDAIGRDDFREVLLRWLPLADKPRPRTTTKVSKWDVVSNQLLKKESVDLFRGVAWCCGLEADRNMARALAALALSAYRKIPSQGARHVSLGNAAVAALGMMPGMDAVGQLAMLRTKLKSIPAQKEAEKALAAAATREGLPRDEIDELAVPTYGMEEVGRRVETLGEYTAEVVVDGPDAHLRWTKADKPLKSAPAAAKKDHPEEVKELQAVVKDVGKMLTAQRERIDSLFLAQKAWAFDAWRERYLDHPLVGGIARRLIWIFEADGRPVAGAWLNDRIVGVDDVPLEGLGESTRVALWHPIDRAVDEVLAWRDWFDRHRVRQPFKQAHREVYVLTDAERNTRVYSNRFAAHVLRQHQYHALCAARGWRNRLRLMVDDSYPPSSRDLPEWGLRAEFWVEGIGEDVTDSGAYAYLGTDQVRFYEIGAAQRMAHAGGGGYSAGWNRADAEPVTLDRVPPLVLSEVLRDVDLFVGVASVGNDPNWSDGGPGGRYANYWQAYSFGDLTANGKTRKAVLERLVPRLKIADRCSFGDKFLVVRGDLRTYKIHLGSGNILMEPNDQYLCIVPKRSDPPRGEGVFLPFEGDGVLSIILSKALMLADDRKITDPTITSQIGRK